MQTRGNRLSEIDSYDGSGTLLGKVLYTYNTNNDRIGMVQQNGSGNVIAAESYVNDSANLLLVLNGSGNITSRMLAGPAGNQVWAEE